MNDPIEIKDMVADHFSLKNWVSSDEYRRLTGLTYADYQLAEAIDFLKLTNNTNKYEPMGSLSELRLNQALFRSFISSYAKCFNKSEAKGKTPLDPKDVYKKNKRLLDIHKQVMDVRDEFVAHSGNNSLQIAHLLIEESDDEINLRCGIETYRNEVDFDLCFELASFAQKYVKEKIRKDLSYIQKKSGKTISYK